MLPRRLGRAPALEHHPDHNLYLYLPSPPRIYLLAPLQQTAELHQPEEKDNELLELELAHCRMVLNQQKKALERLEKEPKNRRSSLFRLFRGAKSSGVAVDIEQLF